MTGAEIGWGILGGIFSAEILCAVAVVAAWVLAERSWWRALVGPGRDWPRVAARLAAGLMRREDPAVSLRAVRLMVGRVMRRRIDAVLVQPLSELGPQMVDAGIVPHAQAAAFRTAAGADLAQLCLAVKQPSASEAPSAQPMLIFAVAILGLSFFIAVMIFPKLADMLSSLGAQPAWFGMAQTVLVWMPWIGLTILMLGIAIAGIGLRLGWWSRWRRAASGLILLDGVHARQAEAEQASRLSAIWPQRADALQRAGQAGDWRALAAASGWRVHDGQDLIHALDLAAERRARRSRQWGLALRIVGPLVLALPVGLLALTVMIPFISIEAGQVARLQSRPLPSGGSPAIVIIELWTHWIGAQVERAEELGR